jgi:hypothetical protein
MEVFIMDVYDFCILACDSYPIAVYDMTKNEEVFNGEINDLMYSDYANYEVMSFDLDNGKIILNIETEEED